ncbi:MAG TPA: serine hydrolase [Candidatus Eisenbacteria bacterium]|uniref:Serine hydrolase n=1 Tax=Eiseniibacteriota bacterium TaxID=2212470 RepID=A0A7V2AVX6_UNCEI|nr:serine hydrolase [Candidatus Eisenbacteria bacterium]
MEDEMKRSAACVVSLCLLSSACAAERDDASRSAPSAQDASSHIERVEKGLVPSTIIEADDPWRIEDRMQHYGVPGVAIAVVEDFGIAWVKGYGVVDAGKGGPVTEETLFQAASISKPVTAVIALRLAERGLLDLDEDVNALLRSWKVPEIGFTRERKVTIRRILNHTAGTTVHGFRGYAEDEPVPTILDVLDGKPPSNSDAVRVDKVPGESFRYSGGGTTILQLLLEDVTGRPLADLADEFVFAPLGMAQSSFENPLPPALEAETSKGHLTDGTVITGFTFLQGGSSCCGLWTTPADLARLGIEISRAYRGESDRMLSRESASLMVSPSAAGSAGLGMFIDQRGEERYFYHGGGNVGFKCVLIMHRDEGYGTAVMTNGDRGNSLIQEIVNSIAREYGWADYPPETFETFDELILFYRELRERDPGAEEITEGSLNRYGYELLGEGAYDRAIAILTLNTEFHPESANCWDSLAEAYLTQGDRERAIELYRKALGILRAHPEANEPYRGLGESIPRRLRELGAGTE